MNWYFERGTDANIEIGDTAFSERLNGLTGDLKKETSVFIRETISNCADQGVEDNLDPIEVDIDVITLSGDAKKEFLNELDWKTLKGHIRSAIKEPNTNTSHGALYSGIRKLSTSTDKIKLIRISDYNSIGLIGDEDDETKNFHLFSKAEFCTTTDRKSQGSFGLGKGVLYHRSTINTVLMSSCINHEGEIKTRAFGRTTIPTHRYDEPGTESINPSGRWLGPGFFGIKNQEPTAYKADSVFDLDTSTLKKLFLQREGDRTGTTVICVAFESEQDTNLIHELTDDVRKWFWPAISQNNPRIKIKVREFNNHDLVGTPHNVEINEVYQPFADCLNLEKNSKSLDSDGDIISKEIEFPVPKRNKQDADEDLLKEFTDEDENGFSARLEIKALKTNQDHSKINHLVYLRDNLTVVQYKQIKSNSVKGFVAVCKAGRSKGSSIRDERFHDFLRLAEPALHDNWKYSYKVNGRYLFDVAASTKLNELDALILKTAQDFVNKDPEVSKDNLNLLSQKFNFGKGGTITKSKQLDYEKIDHGVNGSQIYIKISINNLREDLSDWQSKIDFKIIGINGNDNNLVIDSLEFDSIDNSLISHSINKRNAYIKADRAIERFSVKIIANTPKLFSKSEIKDLRYSLSVNAYAGENNGY
jgi:hypothetical protein|tara:strand:- start:194 stop:2128 length:1935 start_codon:yes stop_codon:yes gene_type:complete